MTTDRAYEPLIMNYNGNEKDDNIHVYLETTSVFKFTSRKYLVNISWFYSIYLWKNNIEMYYSNVNCLSCMESKHGQNYKKSWLIEM